ncbi:MAG: L-aspartate oxidase, partial [Bacteroidota bacterium]
KAADYGTVTIITKANEDESNTKYAQGGIAAVTHAPDSYEKHIQDTLNCGDDLCDEKIVRTVITESGERIKELIHWGADFDKTSSGEFDLALEGGHSEHRVLHHKDSTGLEIEQKLLEQIHKHKNIKLFTHYFAVDNITQHHLGIEVKRSTPGIECYGAYVLNTKTGKVETILSRTVLMATGGAGQVYRTTTNPVIATADGVVMAYRAMAKVKNMEFVQFHPTALYRQGENPSFLISEAVRGFGAVLKTQDEKEFMHKYDTRGSLAPRDIVARAIDSEMKKSGEDFVLLDCRHLDVEKFKEHFPNIYKKCLSIGIDISTGFIPVVPAAHYMCGGISVDENGCSSIKNLYAIGECSCTGLHGANRLASNSLLEALVFSHRTFLHSKENFKNNSFKKNIPEWSSPRVKEPAEMVLITQSRKEVQEIMSSYVGIFRSDMRLKRALDRLKLLYLETEDLYERWTLSPKICELRNLINAGYLIVKAAMARTENRGLHFNVDN